MLSATRRLAWSIPFAAIVIAVVSAVVPSPARAERICAPPVCRCECYWVAPGVRRCRWHCTRRCWWREPPPPPPRYVAPERRYAPPPRSYAPPQYATPVRPQPPSPPSEGAVLAGLAVIGIGIVALIWHLASLSSARRAADDVDRHTCAARALRRRMEEVAEEADEFIHEQRRRARRNGDDL